MPDGEYLMCICIYALVPLAAFVPGAGHEVIARGQHPSPTRQRGLSLPAGDAAETCQVHLLDALPMAGLPGYDVEAGCVSSGDWRPPCNWVASAEGGESCAAVPRPPAPRPTDRSHAETVQQDRLGPLMTIGA
jgi:hypothetical protein